MRCRRSYLLSRAGIWVVLLLLCLTACALQDTSIPSLEEDGETEAKAPSPLGVALLYIPNRIFDVAELVRLGVNVGRKSGLDWRTRGSDEAR